MQESTHDSRASVWRQMAQDKSHEVAIKRDEKINLEKIGSHTASEANWTRTSERERDSLPRFP